MVHGDVDDTGGAVIEEGLASTANISRGILTRMEGLK